MYETNWSLIEFASLHQMMNFQYAEFGIERYFIYPSIQFEILLSVDVLTLRSEAI